MCGSSLGEIVESFSHLGTRRGSSVLSLDLHAVLMGRSLKANCKESTLSSRFGPVTAFETDWLNDPKV